MKEDFQATFDLPGRAPACEHSESLVVRWLNMRSWPKVWIEQTLGVSTNIWMTSTEMCMKAEKNIVDFLNH